ncbi:alpha/beta fold hydrolase [Actinoplanes sp. DH11]|uniref:alpha/beta fold hydrolase n=1 Tax=Actinoplanes sp. DH11 TaxID=2857011 RepID=UPI001E44D41A|nr:alpha/beta hydrolase [Actinoplanes sp. DH11]
MTAPVTPAVTRRRRWPIVVTLVLALPVAGWLLLRDTSPVGHFTSAEGRDHYVGAYQKAFAAMGRPADTLDVRTGYGIVRAYRYTATKPGTGGGSTGPPLLLLPGTASGAPVWADNLPSLLRLRDVYLLDLLGEPGRSVQNRPIRDHADQAAWLHEVLEALPDPRVHLVGLSIGGWTATNLAVRQSAAVAGLILIDPACTFTGIPFEVVVRSLPASVRWLPRSWRDSFNSWTAGGAPVDDSPVADMIESGMRHYAMKLPAPQQFTDDQLRSVTVPSLVILAGDSIMHDAAVAARKAGSTLPAATVLTYPGASHAVNGEQPDRIAADIAAFLERTGR